MEITNVTVLGAGIMGNGIAQTTAQAGYKVILRDMNIALINKGLENIEKSLERFVRSGKMTAEVREQVLDRISTTTDMDVAVKDADVVIEAVPEKIEIKKAIFQELDKKSPRHALLCTNTSQLSITDIASVTSRRDKVIGTHFFNPPVVMKLVEIVKGLETSEETLEVIKDFCCRLGKETIVCRDSQGFVTSRLTLVQRIEAYRIFEEGVATKEDIDKAMRLAFNHPMGPFELADLVGLDVGLNALQGMAEAYGDRFRPPQILRHMVAAGNLGRKTGKGFYKYKAE